MGEISEINERKKEQGRKGSIMLPSSGASLIDGKTGSSLAAAGSNVIGGVDNYKRYQMLVSGMANGGEGNKRSTSLLGDSKKYPIKRTVTMNDNTTRKKTSKLS